MIFGITQHKRHGNFFKFTLQLYLHYFITTFKIKHKLYITSGSATPPGSQEAFLTLPHFLPGDAYGKPRRSGDIQPQTITWKTIYIKCNFHVTIDHI